MYAGAAAAVYMHGLDCVVCGGEHTQNAKTLKYAQI